MYNSTVAKYVNDELSLDALEPSLKIDSNKDSSMDYIGKESEVASNQKALAPSKKQPRENESKSLEDLLEENTIDKTRRRIPHLDVSSVRRLAKPLICNNAILLTPLLTDVSASLRKALIVVCKKLESMDPDLSFQHSKKDLHCRGCFSQDFDTCTFVGQLCCFSVTPDDTQYIYQLRRTSYGGREPFDWLLRAVASALECEGYAKEYADGFKILPMLTIDDNEIDKSSTTTLDIGSCSANSLISLDSEHVTLLSWHVAERKYPLSNETLRIMAKCCASSSENCEMLIESEVLGKELVRILDDSNDPSSCLNALKLIECGASAPRDSFKAVARCMTVYCVVKPSGDKWIQSQAIENAALGAMNVLMRRLQTNERKKIFSAIKKVLSGKVTGKLLREVEGICLRQ